MRVRHNSDNEVYQAWLPPRAREEIAAEGRGKDQRWWLWFAQGNEGTIHREVKRAWSRGQRLGLFDYDRHTPPWWRVELPRGPHDFEWGQNPTLPCDDPYCRCAGEGHQCAGCGAQEPGACCCKRCEGCKRLIKGRRDGSGAPVYVTEDDEVLCGRCYRPNPGDEWLRRRERTAAASGTVEDTIRFANERKRRGGDVAPWELVPIAYTFLEAWKEIEPKVTLITPTSGSLNLDGGRVEAYRHAAFKPWLMGAPDKPERFYVTACSYPLLAYGEIPEHRGQDEELEGHVNAVESWRHAGAIVVRLDLGDVQALHDKHHFGTGPDPAGCSYCQRNREGAQRVLVQEDNARNALTTPKVWGGRPPRGVLFPAQWDWARLMKRRGGRWRNPRG